MRISRTELVRRWRWTTLVALGLFAGLAMLDIRLRQVSGFGTADLQGCWTLAQYKVARFAWMPGTLALRAGFNLGLDYLLMPLYAASFFYSGVLARERFAPRPGRLRRLLAILAMAPLAAAVLDAAENALEMWSLLAATDDAIPRLAFAISNAKIAALVIGLALLLAAGFGEVMARAGAKAAPL